ncbi:MAG: PQQ-binding-like beta-propeller repeat protein [Candidatus Hydrogenedentes bacterium]|nr:PQQ-binding-like beta-propeller repeat protein [Candidatus Hydrogenedentota bacterium]
MTEKKFRALAPGVAVVLIVLCAVAAEYWFVQAPESTIPKQQVNTKPAYEPPPAPAKGGAPVTADWPVYHGGADLAGATDCRLPDKPGILWQCRVEGSIHQPPVGDSHGIYVATRAGTVMALEVDGKERWKKQLVDAAKTDGSEPRERFDAPIACFRSTVVIGSKAGVVHALDTADGTERWTYDVGAPILGTVNLYAPKSSEEPARLYVIKQDDGALHCIDFNTGKPIWQGRAVARSDGSPAVGDGIVVYGSCASALHIFAAQEARLLTSIELGEDCQVAAGPALAGGDVYSGSRGGKFFRVNVGAGRIVWTNSDSKKEIFTTPAVGQDMVVFGSEDGGVYAVDRDSGRLKWRFDTHRVPTSAVIASDKIAVGAGGVFYLLKSDTGEKVWSYEVSDGIASPAIINGMVVVGSEDGTIMAFGEKPAG